MGNAYGDGPEARIAEAEEREDLIEDGMDYFDYWLGRVQGEWMREQLSLLTEDERQKMIEEGK